MGRAKEIRLKVIPSKIANDFIKKYHYSGKVVANSTLHFGCFLDDKLGGVMSYGSSLDKSKTIGLVKSTKWNEFLELNRMAFSDMLPKYSESRCIAISIKLLKKNAPHIKWILSYSDGCECGDGTIYRASGFKLTMIKPNSDIYINKKGIKVHSMTIKSNKRLISKYGNWKKAMVAKYGKCEKLKGNQLRYIYLIDKKAKLNCENLQFNEIDKMGAGMYKGKKITITERKNASIA